MAPWKRTPNAVGVLDMLPTEPCEPLYTASDWKLNLTNGLKSYAPSHELPGLPTPNFRPSEDPEQVYVVLLAASYLKR